MLPAGVVTRELQVGPAFDLVTGAPYAIRVLVSPSRKIRYNGVPLIPTLHTYRFAPEVTGLLPLPATDQQGYEDASGNEIVLAPGENSHTYNIRVFYLLNSAVVKALPEQRIALPYGDGTPIPLTSLVSAPSTPNEPPVLIPDAWSQALADALEAAEEAAASAAAAQTAAENVPALVDGTLDEWMEEHQLPDTITGFNILGWPQFIILESGADASSVPDGSFIVRLPVGWTP